MTPHFKVNYSKKGLIPSGDSEEIFVMFTPDAYQYYYDCVRIHCEGENLIIPVHGFPIVNNSKDSLLPSLIDMGKVEVGDQYSKKLSIECTTPINFEYSIQWIKPHADILVEPLEGDIPGNSKTWIEITYIPRESTTAQAEFKFITTEFESKPEIVKIVGSAVHSQVNVQKKQTQSVIEEETVVTKKKGKTLLQKKPKRPASRTGKLQKINAEKLTETGKEVMKLGEQETARSKIMTGRSELQETKVTGIQAKLREEEREFLGDYKKLEELDREKEIKFFPCQGDPAMTSD